MDQEKIELTFETPAAPAAALEAAAPQQAVDQALAAAEQMAQRLSPEEQKMVDDLCSMALRLRKKLLIFLNPHWKTSVLRIWAR